MSITCFSTIKNETIWIFSPHISYRTLQRFTGGRSLKVTRETWTVSQAWEAPGNTFASSNMGYGGNKSKNMLSLKYTQVTCENQCTIRITNPNMLQFINTQTDLLRFSCLSCRIYLTKTRTWNINIVPCSRKSNSRAGKKLPLSFHK